jgi:beta-fructofuranosidase
LLNAKAGKMTNRMTVAQLNVTEIASSAHASKHSVTGASISRREFVFAASAAALSSGPLFSEDSGNSIASDRHRPLYHLMPPSNWMNDPNGPLYWKGRYHMFYQYSPSISNQGTKYWGHAVSTDLVHWKNLGIALKPSPGGADKDGCWTGSAVVSNGVPTIIYTGATWSAESERAERAKGLVPERQMVAVAADPQDVDLIKWAKIPQDPVLAAPPPGMKVTGWRDPCVWKEGETWYMVIGSGELDMGGMALLYSSADLKSWNYLHPLAVAQKDQVEPAAPFGAMWECPDFFTLGGMPFLLVSRGNSYLTGSYSDHYFHQTGEGQIDFGSVAYAQKTMLDGKGGRLWWAWIREKRSIRAQAAAGWAGVMSLPKILTARSDGMLGMDPVTELKILRGRSHKVPAQQIDSDGPLLLQGVSGDCLEIEAEFDVGGAKQCGLRVRSTADGAEQTLIGYEPDSQTLFTDTTMSSQDPEAQPASNRGVQRGVLPLGNEPLRLRVFLDASVIEVFANSRASISDRAYPLKPASVGIGLFSKGGSAQLRSMTIWELKPISNDRLTSGAELFRV